MHETLPFIDEHTRQIAAPAPATWEAVHAVMTAPPSGRTERYARLVGARGGRPFAVAASEPPNRLELVGEHHRPWPHSRERSDASIAPRSSTAGRT